MSRKNHLLEMFEQIKEDKLSSFQEKILFVDGTNTFIRSLAVNPSLNDNGDHVGGIIGFLLSVGFAIKTIRPTRVIILFDGRNGSKLRKQIYPEYKSNRSSTRVISSMFRTVDEERLSMLKQMSRLIDYLRCFPLQFVVADDIEADDAIAYYVTEKFKNPNIQKIIMSTDQDYLQLVNNSTIVWSPTRKIFYTAENFRELVGIHHNNFLTLKVVIGDTSDNVPGIKGCGLKTMEKRFPMLFEEKNVTIEELIEYATKQSKETKYKIYQDFVADKDKLFMNYKLVQLLNPIFSNHIKILLSNSVDKPNQSLDQIKFLRYITEDRLNLNLKNPDFWIRDVWFNLQLSNK